MTLIQHLRPASLALIAVALFIPLGNGLAHADEVAQTRAERREHRQEASEGRRDRVRERSDAVRGDRSDTRREFRQNRREDRRDSRQDRRTDRRDFRHVDQRAYRHYPRRGAVIHSLPRGHRVITHRHNRYYFSNGAWYRPSGGRFVVIVPPIGIVVPILPYGYVTMHIGRNDYYLANDVYYVRRPNGYVVVEPPEGAPRGREDDDTAGQEQIYIYPRNGQSAQQQSTDRYECHNWARDETGFDPTRQFADVSDEQIDDLRSDYHRAMGACLDARGYTVR